MNKFFNKVFAMVALVAGVQGAFATLNCTQFSEGTVYLKLPTGWDKAYAMAAGSQTPFSASTKFAGWYEISTTEIGGSMNMVMDFFISDLPLYGCVGDQKCISRIQMNEPNMRTDMNGFSCSDFNRETGELWISEDPSGVNLTVPYVGGHAPDAKFFYVLIPDNLNWKSSIPMYSTDGTYAGGRPLSVASDLCGWYYAMWLDEEPPNSMVVFMDTDSLLENAIGVGGWNADELKPINVKSLFTLYGSDKIYFVPDVDLWDEVGEQNMGFYGTDPGVADPSLCSYSLAALLYDTDASLHGAFTCDNYPQVGTNGCYVATAQYQYTGGANAKIPCIGVTPGIVDKKLPHDKADINTYKKPVYNAASGCFANKEAFDVMFRETPGVNFLHCRDVPFTLAKDGLWEYDSFNEPTGAFTPLNDLADSVKAGLCTGTCATAATLRAGQGNVVYGSGSSLYVSDAAKQLLGNVTNWAAKNPATGLPYIDSYPAAAGEFDSGANPDVYDNTTWDLRKKGNNNQMFCFESHANFKFRPGMKFYFRGDDDIWVFIDNTLAVDLGGTHLAAPASVDLDKFTGENGKSLVVGKQYDIDIFFCDRRTEMSNVRIKTNMYIQQTSGLEMIPSKKDGKTEYELCYTESGDGSCASVARGGGTAAKKWCGNDIPRSIVYTIQTVKGVTVAENLIAGQPTSVYFGGIDLTQKASPVIDKNKITGLAPGRYNLVSAVDGAGGKPVKIPFKIDGSLDILPQDGIAVDSNGLEISGGSYKVVSAAMPGQMIPIYVSAMNGVVEGQDVEMDVSSAAGQSYILNAGGLSAFVKIIDSESGEAKFESLATGTPRTIPESGVDTVYVTLPKESMEGFVKEYKVFLEGFANSINVRFFVPKIFFVDDEGMFLTGDSPKNELMVGSSYTFNLMAFEPTADGKIKSTCNICDFDVVLGPETSAGIQLVGASKVSVKGGQASVTIRSGKIYRYNKDAAKDNPATLHVVGENPEITSAVFSPLHFKEPEVAYPVFADIFDVRGTVHTGLGIPSPYYEENQKYLDGIADSVVVYFNRALHKDSLPTSLVIHWDDAEDADSVVIDSKTIKKAASCGSVDKEKKSLCLSYIGVGHLALSKKVKTSGEGYVSSWLETEEGGEKVNTSFVADIVDRIAPVPLSATLTYSKSEKNVEKVSVVMSEPVRVKKDDFKLRAFDFYRFSDGLNRDKRYGHPTTSETIVEDSVVTIRFKIDKNAPQVGDYLRLRADHSIWTDMVTLDSKAKRSEIDVTYNWNYPTTFDATKRLPSPWVPIVLGKVNPGEYDGMVYAKPTFRVVMTGGFTFKIVFKKSAQNAMKSYSVMDLKGGVVKTGAISGDETSVSVKNAGSYIVRVGRGSQLVNFK